MLAGGCHWGMQHLDTFFKPSRQSNNNSADTDSDTDDDTDTDTDYDTDTDTDDDTDTDAHDTDDYHHVDPPLGKGRLSPLQGLLHPRRCTFPSVQVDFPLS